MRISIVLVVAAIGLVGCGEKAPSRIQSTPQGLFYTSWMGGLFQIVDGKLVRLRKAAPPPEKPRTLTFHTVAPGLSNAGFPVKISGGIKLDGDVRKIRISLELGALGKRVPTADDQARFADGLAAGTERLRSVNLSFFDVDGYVAAPPRGVNADDAAWTRSVDEQGKSNGYQFGARDPSSPDLDSGLVSVQVGWSEKPGPPNLSGWAIEPPGATADDAAPAAADAVPADQPR